MFRSKAWMRWGFVLIVVTGIGIGGTWLWAQSQQREASPAAQQELAKAREAYAKARAMIQDEKVYSCCIEPGCLFCGMSAGKCPCGENLLNGKPVCPECYGGWYAGQGRLPGIDVKEDVKFLPQKMLNMMYEMRAMNVPEQTAATQSGEAEKESALAAVSVTGETTCAHCEFGVNPISDPQSMGIAVKANDGKVYVVEGGQSQYPDIYRARFSGLTVSLKGAVKKTEGQFVWVEPTELKATQ